MITVDELKAMPLDEPIGEAVICDIERMANEGLQPFYQREFEPYEGVYRVNDFAKYVSEDSWRKFWSAFPEWCVSRCSCCTTILVPMIIVSSLLKCFLV